MFYTEAAALRPGDYNAQRRLSPSAVLTLLELAGAHHSESVKDGLVTDGVAWILSQWRVEIRRRPQFGEPVSITTWTRPKTRTAFVYREFLASAPDGTEYFRARAKLTRFDLNAHRLARIDDALYAAYGPEEKSVFDGELPRLHETAHYDREFDLPLRRSDMDYNGHVHNTRYLDFALDTLSEADYRRDAISGIRILYHAPLTERSQAQLRLADAGKTKNIGIYADGQLCTLMELTCGAQSAEE